MKRPLTSNFKKKKRLMHAFNCIFKGHKLAPIGLTICISCIIICWVTVTISIVFLFSGSSSHDASDPRCYHTIADFCLLRFLLICFKGYSHWEFPSSDGEWNFEISECELNDKCFKIANIETEIYKKRRELLLWNKYIFISL